MLTFLGPIYYFYHHVGRACVLQHRSTSTTREKDKKILRMGLGYLAVLNFVNDPDTGPGAPLSPLFQNAERV
jgi:hypothetical protein